VKGERVRNSAKTVLHTLYLLKQLPSLDSLPVNDLIYILGKSPMDFFFSVADPDPGSGAFLTPGSGINIPDPQHTGLFKVCKIMKS
jgi:hypothetical protein